MKKMVNILLVAAMILSASVPVCATDFNHRNEDEIESQFSLRYRYVSDCELSASKSGSKIQATATARINNGANSSKTIITLERKSGSGYTNAGTIKNSGSVTSKKYSTSGSITVSGDYTYRVKAVVYVYDSNNRLLDSDTFYSMV